MHDTPEPSYHELVSRADLIYSAPAESGVEGQPIGNGVMGTAVWTTPNAIHFQINRCDVFAVNKDHAAGPQQGPTDYCGTCAQVTVEVGGQPFAPGEAFAQRLSLHEAEVSITGAGLSARCFVSAVADVLVLELDDRREEPGPLGVTFRRWRPERVTTAGHVATLGIGSESGRLLTTQQFNEGDYHCASAVAAQVVGREPEIAADGAESLAYPARSGKTIILISSAASWEEEVDTQSEASELLDRAAVQSYEELRRPHLRWWGDFWSRTFVHASSADGVADKLERARHLHLYVMASSSRGALPSKWNGLLFTTEGDTRAWGAQFWMWTTEMGYWPLYASDAADLAETFFRMYRQQLPDCEEAARQRWGAGGAYYGETVPFDGPVVLPEEVAAEFRDVYAGRKKNSELSARACKLGQYESNLHVLVRGDELADGRYSWISHVSSSGCELAVHAWWRYRYTGDVEWLRATAYPLLRGAVEFYRHLVTRGDDGRYHVMGMNVHEDFWGANDGIMDLAAIRGAAPLAIHAAEILDTDVELRKLWQDLLDRLAPYPMGSDPQAQELTGAVLADDVWAAGHRGAVDGQHNPEDVWLNPVFPFEDWTLETQDRELDRIVHKLLDLAPRHAEVLKGAGLTTAIRTPIASVRAGRAGELPAIAVGYWAAFSPLPNGLSLFEGENAQSCEHLGLLTMVLQESLLQSVSARPGGLEVVRVFPAWPRQWEASFRLLARGGFLVTSRMREGTVEFVELESRRGETCRLRNPWDVPCSITDADGAVRELEGDVLTFTTTAGATYRVLAGEGAAR